MQSDTNPYREEYLVELDNDSLAKIDSTAGVTVTEHFALEGLPFEACAIDADADAADALRSYGVVSTVEAEDFSVTPSIAGPTPIDDPSERAPHALADASATIEDVYSLHDIPLPVPDIPATMPPRERPGNGVTCVVMDSGIDTTHEVFEGVSVRHVDATQSLVTEISDPPSPTDAVGHGTAVAGQLAQIAPGADLISLRIFGTRGSTDGRTVLRAYEWLHATAEPFAVVNCSWGTSEPVDVIDRVHNALIARGVRTCSAAGNSGGKSGSPATASEAFSAAACDKYGRIAPFSSYNPGRDNPDVSLLGADVRLAQATGTQLGRQLPGRWVSANGTSFSSPELAGLVARYLSDRDRATPPDTQPAPPTPAQIQRDFEAAARPVEDSQGRERDGAGLADYGKTVTTYNHESEHDFETHVVELLHDEYPDSEIRRQYHLPSRRIIDILVTNVDGYYDLCFELENDSSSVLNGSGQARYYAQERHDELLETNADHANTVPVLCIPEGHIDPEERGIIQATGVVVREIAVPADVSLEGV